MTSRFDLTSCKHNAYRCEWCRMLTLRRFVRVNRTLRYPAGDDAIARLVIEHVTGIPVVDQLDAEAAARCKAGTATYADKGGLWRVK